MDYLHKNIFGVVLNEVAWYLTPDELEFWSKYVKYFENENISLFLFGGSCSILNNAYFNEELYYNLQKKLGNAKYIIMIQQLKIYQKNLTDVNSLSYI